MRWIDRLKIDSFVLLASRMSDEGTDLRISQRVKVQIHEKGPVNFRHEQKYISLFQACTCLYPMQFFNVFEHIYFR